MNIIRDIVCEHDEERLAIDIEKVLEKIPEKKRGDRNRILRFGWDYKDPNKWLGDIPFAMWRHITWPEGTARFDSVTINEYLRGQSISPHLDSPAFGDVAILSLLSDTTMRFTSPVGETLDFVLPRRSLAAMSGEFRTKWQHSTLPLDADKRISVVFRKRV